MEDQSEPRIGASPVCEKIEDPSSFGPAMNPPPKQALLSGDDAHTPAVPPRTDDPTWLPPTEQALSTDGCVDGLAVTKTKVQVTESEVPLSPEKLPDPVLVKGNDPAAVDCKDPTVDGNPVQGGTDKPLVSSPGSDIDDSKMKLPRYQFKDLYIVDLHASATDRVDELSELFGRVGTLAEPINVISAQTLNQLKPGDGLARCSAHVSFNTVEEACRAWQTFNYHKWMEVPMRIVFFNQDPASRYNEKANIIVTNLDESLDSQTLHHHFGEFGVVISSKVELDRMGKSTGRGFVQFQDEEEAQQAIQKMNNTMLEGNRVNVEFFVRRTDPTESAHLNPAQVNLTPIRPTLAEIVKKNANLIPEVSSNSSCKLNMGSSSRSAEADAVGNTNAKLRSFELQRGSRAQRNEQARRKYKSEKNLKKMLFVPAPSIQAYVPAPSIQAYVPTPSIQAYVPTLSIQASVPAPSSEPWPPQPWSAATLKSMLAGARSQQERTAMLGATLLPLVSMHTKDFASDITNELVTTLSDSDIEGILEMKAEALYQKVEEVKLVIFDRIKRQPPFHPSSSTPSDDVPIHMGYPIAVPMMSEFVEPPELPGMAFYGIVAVPVYPPFTPKRYHLPSCVPEKCKQYGTGYFDISSGSFKDEVSIGSDSEAPVELKEGDTSSSEASNAPSTPEPQASSEVYNFDEDDLLIDTDEEEMTKSDESV